MSNKHNKNNRALPLVLVLAGFFSTGASCGGGGGGGGGGTSTPDTTKPTITNVEHIPKNPVLGQGFQAKVDGSDDKTAASELEVEVTIDTNGNNDFSDETPVTQKDIGNTVNVNTLGNGLLNGSYSIKVTLTDKSGNAASTTSTLYTNPHNSYVVDGSVTEDPTLGNPNAGNLLKYARRLPFYQGMPFGQQLTDLDTILATNALTGTESLLEFVVDKTGKKVTIKVKDAGQNRYANGTWGGDVNFGQLVVDDLARYLSEVITPTEAVTHAGYFRSFDAGNPSNVNSSYAGVPVNPLLDNLYANNPVVVPGVGTVFADIIAEYKPVNGTAVTLAVFVNPTSSVKQLLAQYQPRQDFKVAVLEGTAVTRADLDKALNQ